MPTKIKIYLGLFVFIAGISLSTYVFAQQALPSGGSDFGTTVLLNAGKYQGGHLTGRQELYYSVQVKAGQKVNIEARSFSEAGCTMNLYNEGQEELMSDYATNPKVNWLPNANKSSYKYYVKITNDYADVESFTLEVILTDYYDANSGTDAGDNFESALSLNTIPGSYNGYFSKALYDIPYIGDDDKDYYKISVQKGMPYEFKVTPPTESGIAIELYDANRQLIEEKESANAGAMISLFLTPAANTNVFLVVKSDLSSAILSYKLEIKSSGGVLTKFYNCKDESCEPAGDYALTGDCQKATAKTCYKTQTCDGKCTSGPQPPPQPVANFYSCNGEKCESVGEYASSEECQEATGMACYQTKNCDQVCGPFPWSDIIPDGIKTGFFSTIWKWLVGGFVGWYLLLYFVLWIAVYVYLAFCLQTLAKKTNTLNPWMAWIPIANIFLMLKIAQKPLWWFILILISPVNIIIGIIIWMKIAERRGKPNWLGILIIVPVIGIAIPGYLAFCKSGGEKTESAAPDAPTGIQEANKPVVGYEHLCKYCDKLIPPNSAVCPLCGKSNPLGPYRCPKCHDPIEKDWKVCSHCNQNLRIVCPFCEKVTFFGDHCEDCGARLLVTCPHCDQEQPPIGDKCIKCGESMEKKEK